jgi:thiol-disulfide isomerase/thioredoxin
MSSTLRLPVEGALPSLQGATGWLNTEPIAPASLRGRPVMVQFWTFTCINWIRTSPYVRAWFEKYRADGLIVVGVHTPEFEVEHDVERIRRAAREMRIEYPIAVDSDYTIWEAFGNEYWPALYFADADGQIRHHRFGEGAYQESEIVLQVLLAAAGSDRGTGNLVSLNPEGVEAEADWDHLRSAETYVGYGRAENFSSSGGAAWDRPKEYAVPDSLALNHWALGGDWTIGRQAAVLHQPSGRIAHRFHARDLHLVMGPAPDGSPVRFRVLLDGKPPGAAHGLDIDEQGDGSCTEPRLHQLIRQPGRVADHTLEITYLDAGIRAYVFTFG